MATIGSMTLLAWVILLGTRAREEPTRCFYGFSAIEARCCAAGQGISAGQCVGTPKSCPSGFQNVQFPVPGCVIEHQKILISGGSIIIGPTDWDSINVVEKRVVTAKSFYIDRAEVTFHRYQECIKAGMCASYANQTEPGLPVTNVKVEAAKGFCAFAGGRLPTSSEWIFAASGLEAHRFPWGPHGLVCRRASFGLVNGPCAERGILPDLAGARADGATPSGLFDMAGNVAELTTTSQGDVVLYGGSFRAKNASELKVWATRPVQIADDVGFRCVYPVRDSTNSRDF